MRQLFPVEEGDERWLAKVMTGSFRPASRLFKAKVLPSPICPFCDTGEEETKEHCFWRCPRWSSIRAEAIHFLEQEGFQVEKSDEPNPTRSGTPALWWCGLMNEDPLLEEALESLEDEKFEVDTPPPRDAAAVADLEQWVEEESGGVTMSRLLLASDGSGLHPTDHRLRRCGYGLFWGSRQHPWNRARKLQGPHQVVPRAELRALLEAVRMTNLPIKVLVDCKFVVDGFKLLDEGKDISHLDHQDLWQALREAMQGGVPHRVQVTKVKAHTTLRDVERGIISFENRWYNDKVDQLAKDGAKMHELPAGAVKAARQRKRWAIILQTMQVRILKARDPLLQAHKKEMERQKPPRVDEGTLPERPSLPARGPCPGATPVPPMSAQEQQAALDQLQQEVEEDSAAEMQQQRLEEIEALEGMHGDSFDDQEEDDEYWVQKDAEEAKQIALRARQQAETLAQQRGVPADIAQDLSLIHI